MLSEQRRLNKLGIYLLKVKHTHTEISTHMARQPGLSTWEGSLSIKGAPALASQDEMHFIFILNIDGFFFLTSDGLFSNN